MTEWTEHPDHPDMYYRVEGRTVQLAGRDVVEGKPLLWPRTYYDYVWADPPIDLRPIQVAVNADIQALAAVTRTAQGGTPVIHVSAEASAPSKRMTLAELAAFVEHARSVGVPDTAGLNVTSRGLGHLRKISTEDGTSE